MSHTNQFRKDSSYWLAQYNECLAAGMEMAAGRAWERYIDQCQKEIQEKKRAASDTGVERRVGDVGRQGRGIPEDTGLQIDPHLSLGTAIGPAQSDTEGV